MDRLPWNYENEECGFILLPTLNLGLGQDRFNHLTLERLNHGERFTLREQC